MQSLFRIIKSEQVMESGTKEIVTDTEIMRFVENEEHQETGEMVDEKLANSFIEEAEAKAKLIIEEANIKAEAIISEAEARSEEIINEANAAAVEIEKEANDKGYSDGKQQGYEQAYEETTKKGMLEAERIITNANAILFNAKREYEEYIQNKEDEIINMTVNMAQTVLKAELSLPHSLDENIKEILENSRNMSSCIIRANAVHCRAIEENIESWKMANAIKCEVFIIPDEELGEFNAVIEKNNGRVEIGLDAGLEGIKKTLF